MALLLQVFVHQGSVGFIAIFGSHATPQCFMCHDEALICIVSLFTTSQIWSDDECSDVMCPAVLRL